MGRRPRVGGDVGYHLPLAIRQARLAHTYSDGHTRATLGNLGGVLVTEELVVAIKGFAGRLVSGLCCGSAIDALLEQIRQASDIGQDGTQDPTKVCDAISIGLGYETTRSQLGDPAPPSAPLDACTGVTCP